MVAFSPELGIATFIGAKWGVYIAAGTALRRTYPETKAAAWIIGSVRLVAGIAAGILYFLIWTSFIRQVSSPILSPVPFLLGLAVVSMILWTILIALFCDRQWHAPARTLVWAAAGTALSLLIDGAGFLLALPSRNFHVC